MNRVWYLLANLALGLSLSDARGDGGIMRAHETQGPFAITIFTASELQQGCPMDVSVMVQERDSNEAVLDATVTLVFTPPSGPQAEPVEQVCGASGAANSKSRPEQFKVEATRRQASNKLLYAATVTFAATGDWKLQAFVTRDTNAVKIVCRLPISSPPQKLAGLLPYLGLPPLMVGLFALNQRLRKQKARQEHDTLT